MKQGLIKQLNSSRKRLLEVMTKVPNNEILIDKWGKKEILSHLTGWEEEYVTCIPQVLSGDKPRSFKISVNRFNEESVKKRNNKAIPDILNELSDLRSQFIRSIKSLSEKQIASYYGTTFGKKQINILWVINEAISHDDDHAGELENYLDNLY